MKDRTYLDSIGTLMDNLIKGALLTVKANGKVNTMTIGWATIGYIWRKEVFMVAVRDSRYTFEFMENSDNFTVTIPSDDQYRKAIAFCGTKSGRDYDKYAECGLKTANARRVASPVIAIPGVHYECRIIYKSAMDPAFLAEELKQLYAAGDYHTLYFGEILSCYETA